jgi:spermidine/putrescine transport system ATP-binding protein
MAATHGRGQGVDLRPLSGLRAPDAVDAFIGLRNVHKRFGAVHAVRGVSLDVRQNEFITLLGPSGCGKTTLLRLIGGLETADEGTVVVAGLEVDRTPPRSRQTRMVFQHYALFPHMTVAENVAFGLRMRSVPRPERERRVRVILEMVRLGEKFDAKPSQLSGGQQQRVALARALVTEPQVLLLDEPLAALDLQLRKNMQLELKNLQRSLGITFVYVTHDQGEALTMSDRIVVMDAGRIQQVGSGQEIYDRPATRFVARFIGEANVFEGHVVEAKEATVRLEVDGTGLELPWEGGGLAPGESVAFMVRPEKLEVVLRNSDDGTLLGCVAQRIYLGATVRLVVATGADRQVLVDAQEDCPARIGDVVRIGWKPGAVRWLK